MPRVEVAYARPDKQEIIPVQVPDGTTAVEAVRLSGITEIFPEIDADFFRNATVVTPPTKKQLTLRLDDDVLMWLKNQGKGYQSRINAILRAYYEANR